MIYMFESESREGLFAFAGDASGSQLPERHGPWRAAGDGKEPRLSRVDRTTVEQAVQKDGFQLWRRRTAPE